MPVFTRRVMFPLQLTARDAASADRDALDLAEAAAAQVEERDVAGTLTVGKVTVTKPFPEPSFPRWIIAYGQGEGAMGLVAQWLAEGKGVDSRLVRGLWVHRPVAHGGDVAGAGA